MFIKKDAVAQTKETGIDREGDQLIASLRNETIITQDDAWPTGDKRSVMALMDWPKDPVDPTGISGLCEVDGRTPMSACRPGKKITPALVILKI